MAPKRTTSAPSPPPPPRLRPARAAPAVAPAPLPAARWQDHLPPVVLLPLLALALYWPALDGPFVYDDPNAVTQSNLIRTLWPPWDFLSFSTRPLTDYSFALDYARGALDPRPYHLTSLFLHAISGLLLYAIAVRTLALPVLAARYGAPRRWIGAAAAALFIAHPLASETVAYVSSRSEVLASTFYLTAIASFIAAAGAADRERRVLFATFLFGAAFAGLGSKEIAVTVPLVLLLYDWLFLAGSEWRTESPHRWLAGVALIPLVPLWALAFWFLLYLRLSGRRETERWPGWWWAAGIVLPGALTYEWFALANGAWRRVRVHWGLIGLSLVPLLLGGLVLLVRAYRSGSPLGSYGATAGLGFDRFSRWEYLMTQFGVILYYLRLLVLPIGQTFDYEWPLARTPWAAGVLLPLAALATLAVLAWRAAPRQPLVTFAFIATLVILAPTSSVMPIADLAVERRMYLPLALCMLVAAVWLYDLVAYLPAAWRARPLPAYGALVLLPLLACGALTINRARLWGDPIALHEDGVAKAPDNPRVRLNLGVTYLNLKQPEKAYETLVAAKEIFDRGESVQAFDRIGAFIHYNLGAVLFTRGEPERAKPQLERSLDLGGQYLALRPMALMLLSRIAAQEDDWDRAVAQLDEALKYQEVPDWRVDLAQMQIRAGQVDAARATLAETLRRYPGMPRALQVQRQLEQAS